MARLVYVVHQFLPNYFTGTEQYVFAVARAMQERGHEVEIVALEPDFADRDPIFAAEEEIVDGLPVFRLRFWYHLDRDFERMEYRNPFVATVLRERWERTRPDLVHAFHVRYLGVDLLAEAGAMGVPVCAHLMDFWYLCPAVTLLKRDGSLCDGPPEGGLGCVDCVRPALAGELEALDLMEPLRQSHALWPAGSAPRTTRSGRAATLLERPRVLRDALLGTARIFAPSRFLKRTFAANGYPDDRIDVLTYGVDPARLAARASRRERAPGAPLRVAFIGSVMHHKGTDVAVDAVLATPGAIELRIHGRTTDVPEFGEPLRERASRDPRITFPGPFERERLGEVLADTDVLVVPSRWYENTPFVMLEAFAAGVPVLATDLGGLAELVEDEVSGELFPVGDAADLGRRIARLAREPERLASYRRAIPHVKSIEENAAEIDAVYAELLRQPPARR